MSVQPSSHASTAAPLLIKQVETGAGYVVSLCNQEGVPLPGQMSLRIVSEPGDVVKAVVEFAVGEDVVLTNGDRSPS